MKAVLEALFQPALPHEVKLAAYAAALTTVIYSNGDRYRVTWAGRRLRLTDFDTTDTSWALEDPLPSFLTVDAQNTLRAWIDSF